MPRILIIDDDEQFRTMLQITLKQEGYEVHATGDALKGIRSIEETPFDLVVTDIIMPGKDGIETITELRRQYPRVRIIAMSGGGRINPADYLNMAKMLGAAHTFTKPLAMPDFLAAVRNLIGPKL